MIGSVEILALMLEHADRALPWKAAEFMSKLEMSQGAAYRHLNILKNFQIIRRVSGGYILGELILTAGDKFGKALSGLSTPDRFKELREELYG